jgi:hypothetical protein
MILHAEGQVGIPMYLWKTSKEIFAGWERSRYRSLRLRLGFVS